MKTRLRLFVCLLALHLSASPSYSQEVIGTGTVRSVSARWFITPVGDTIIVTATTVDLSSLERGGLSPRTVVIESDGGTVGQITMRSSAEGLPLLVGDKRRFVLHAKQNGAYKRVSADGFLPNGNVWATPVVSYLVNPASALDPALVLDAVQRSGNTWNNHAAVALVLAGSTPATTIGLDGVNVVLFRFDPSTNLIAETRWWTDGSGHLIDADVWINTIYPFFTNQTGCSGGFYLENTMTHEFGHVLGLRHSTDPDATMFAFSGWCETIRESLAADDILGIQTIYPGGVIITGPPPEPEPIPIPDPPKACKKKGRWAC